MICDICKVRPAFYGAYDGTARAITVCYPCYEDLSHRDNALPLLPARETKEGMSDGN